MHVQADVRRKKTNKDILQASEGYSNADVGEHASIDNIKAPSLIVVHPLNHLPGHLTKALWKDPTPYKIVSL